MNLNKKERYRQLCRQEKIPLFMQAWWMNAVCGTTSWGLCLAEDQQGQIQGALVFQQTKRNGFTIISNPPLSPFAGIWLRYPEGLKKSAKRYSFEHKITATLIEQLPEASRCELNFHYSYTNGLAFHWANFKLLTRYTYVLEDCSDPDFLFANLKSEIRNRIKKARRFLKVEQSDDIEQFFHLNEKTFQRQQLKTPYKLDFLQSIDSALTAKNQRTIYSAKDEQGNTHASIYTVKDQDTVYYLMGASAPEHRSSRALFLLLWEAILDAGKANLKFDFEGTMLPHVEPVFRAFGATQKKYLRIEKLSKIYALLKIILNK